MSKPIKNNSELLYTKAKQLFEQAKEKFDDGTIQSEQKLIDSVFQAFQEFFTSMGKPNMIPRYAPEQGPPWSDDYNGMMKEILKDLTLLFQEVDILGKTLYTDFNHNVMQHDMIQNEFQNVLDKMKDLEAYNKLGKSGLEIGRDDFLNKSKIDYDKISGTPLELINGAITLPVTSRKNVATDAKVSIVVGNRKKNGFIIGTESNGFPGNNTEIHSVTDEVLTNRNYLPSFIGEENNHGAYEAILDGSPNTWFEYEKVNVRDHDKHQVAKNIGWEYEVHDNQTVTWAEDPEDGILKLSIQITLAEEQVINQINCNMYTPPNYGAQTAVVKNILVSDGKEVPYSILPKDRSQDQYEFHFTPVRAKVITIMFEQSHKYITDIGHIYYEKKMGIEDNAEYAMEAATKKYQYAPRDNGPLISLEDLGVQVNVGDSSVKADYPSRVSESNPNNNMRDIISSLLDQVNSETTEMGIEKFEGFRWCIGIRDVEIFSCEYQTEGELVTHPFYFEKPMDKISINVDENIPSTFYENDAMKYDWLKYFISIDDGNTWHPITPIEHQTISENDPPKIYTIRLIENDTQTLSNKEAYLESTYPVYSIRMKVVATRPEESQVFYAQNLPRSTSMEQISPIINSYLFQIESIQENEGSDETDSLIFEGDAGVPLPGPGEDDNGLPGGEDPWGDDDEDGIPNWDDPDHPDYVPNPPDGWEPPGNPGTYPDYPPGDSDGGNIGGPWDDDDGDGIPNWNDPEWKPKLTIEITNKKSEWCIDQDLSIHGHIYSKHPLDRVVFIANGEEQEQKRVEGTFDTFSFLIPANTYPVSNLTIVIKGYDQYGEVIDADVIRMIDCNDLPPEDIPDDNGEEEIYVTIDNKETELCKCDDLIFYGSAQSPNPIRSLVFRINGTRIDPNNLGTPPENDPCLSDETGTIETQAISIKQMTEDDLLEIEDFGDWLEAFEEKNDCGCKNKKKKTFSPFHMQSTPWRIMEAGNEESFYVSIPYWKLQELGINIEDTFTVSVTAYDAINDEATDSYSVLVKDCNKPEEDENGNPRVRDCYLLESVEVHYYNSEYNQIDSLVIPANALPYQEIKNGEGVGITVGWNTEINAPILMQTSGYDESGYTFQVHAVGVHYLNEYDQAQTIWPQNIGDYTNTIKHPSKMIGSPDKTNDWIESLKNGDYSAAPSFTHINEYITFIMSNDWMKKACASTIPNFYPPAFVQPEEPEECDPTEDCNVLTHIVFQLYDDVDHELKTYKIDVSNEGKNQYDIPTKNGVVTVAVGWVQYFQGPAIQIQNAVGTDNLLLTAIGALYRNKCGEADSVWSTQLRYKTNGVQYPELALGEKKTLDDIDWIQDGVVQYDQATYIGKQGDMVAFLLDPSITSEFCEPENPIDSEVGIDPTNPTDVPIISFLNIPESFCYETGAISVHGKAEDLIELQSIEYGITLNGEYIYGPYVDNVEGASHIINFSLDPSQLQIGDLIQLHMKATNIFNQTTEETEDLLVENCYPFARVAGEVTTKATIAYTAGENISLGDFMTEWTEWHHTNPGNWTTQVNEFGRLELINLENQNSHSGWYNRKHLNESDYYFEMKYQVRLGDDDMVGAFFRIQEDESNQVTGFYSIEHDGGGSHVNGKGFRLIKHSYVDGVKTSTLLAEDLNSGWNQGEHRGYKVSVLLEGNKITANLYGEATLSRPDNEPAREPYDWILLTTLSVEDNSYLSGSWGPVTASTPNTYFWDLKMSYLTYLDSTQDEDLSQDITVYAFEQFELEDDGLTKEVVLHENDIGQMYEEFISNILSRNSIQEDQVVQIQYQLIESHLLDKSNNIIPLSNVFFDPSLEDNLQATNHANAILKAYVVATRG